MAVRVVISGEVQGVGFRWWTIRQAQTLGLDGFVRNRLNGTVEAVFSGPQTQVDAMVAACRVGPEGAIVKAVTVEPWSGPMPNGFTRLPTA